jgi:hypothetical protein
VDRERLNVSGRLDRPRPSLRARPAPRITTTLANELVRRNGKYGLLSVCAQGGLGFAMVLER